MSALIFFFTRTVPYLYETLVTPIYSSGWIYYAHYSSYIVIPMYNTLYKGFYRQKFTLAIMCLK